MHVETLVPARSVVT